MRLLDKEIAGRIVRYYAGILGVAASLLLLENAPRVLAATTKLSQPLVASALVLGGLVPEYLAIAGIFGIYATGATLAYRLVRRNELASWSAAGISTLRITAALSTLALVNAGMVLLMLGWLQPQGAIRIAMVDRDIAIGRYGAAFESGQPAPIGQNGTLIFDRIDPQTGFLQGVFVRLPDRTISARNALISVAKGDALKIEFRDGLVIDEQPSDPVKHVMQVVKFDRMDLALPNDPKDMSISELEPFQKLAELPELFTIAGDARSPADTRATAKAEALHRLTLPLLSLLLAWLGFVLGLPDRTVSSLGATGLGVCLIVVILRLADVIRSHTPEHAAIANLALLAATAGLCWLVTRLNHRLELGFIDHALAKAIRKVLHRFERPGWKA